MRIAIAVNKHDLQLAEAQSELIKKQGGLAAHQVILFVSREVSHLDGDICNNYKKTAGRFERVVLNIGKDRSHFENHMFPHVPLANLTFQAAFRHLLKTPSNEEVYWFEPDCVPLDERWADEFSRDYLHAQAMRRFFLGRFLPRVNVVTRTDRKTGEVTRELVPAPGETYMMGSGIYPAKLNQYSALWDKALINPWDATMQWETTRAGENTNKILHNHATTNYKVGALGDRKTPTVLTCDVINDFAHSNEELHVPYDALVIHGCKDTSLIDLVASGGLRKQKAPKSNTPA